MKFHILILDFHMTVRQTVRNTNIFYWNSLKILFGLQPLWMHKNSKPYKYGWVIHSYSYAYSKKLAKHRICAIFLKWVNGEKHQFPMICRCFSWKPIVIWNHSKMCQIRYWIQFSTETVAEQIFFEFLTRPR